MAEETTEPASLFDEVAVLYDRVRPSYPEPIFDALLTECGSPRPDVVEIGPGTGKATAALLERGARVLGVEPGPQLSAFLREKFAGRQLTVLTATFEEAQLPSANCDIVLAATSFHWVREDVRLRKAHAILRPGGLVAVINTVQIPSDVDRGYFARSQAIYERYFPDEAETPLPGDDATPDEFAQIAASDLFAEPLLQRYRWDQRYPTADYADLVRSYSVSARMHPEARESLIAELSALINAEFDGYVVRPLVITLVTARAITG